MSVSPLAALIEETAALHDPPLSLREISRRAGLSPGRVQQLVASPLLGMPQPDSIYGLSKGLQVPAAVIVERCLESLGLPHGTSNSGDPVRDEITRSVRLSARQRRELLALYDAMVGEPAEPVDLRRAMQTARQEADAQEAEEPPKTHRRGNRT